MTVAMGPIESSFRSQYLDARRRLMRVSKPQVLLAKDTGPVWFMPDPAPYDEVPYAQPLWPVSAPRKSASSIIREVAKKHGVVPSAIRGPSRNKALVQARHEAAFRIVFELGYSYPKTGRALGDRDHTTVLNSLRKHAMTSPEAKATWDSHVEIMEATRAAKRKPALHLYFTGGMSIGEISGLLRVSTVIVAQWIGDERDMRRQAA